MSPCRRGVIADDSETVLWVEGDSDRISVDAKNADPDDFIDAIEAQCGTTFRVSGNTAFKVSARFDDLSAAAVMARLLRGINHVIAEEDDGIRVWVTGLSKKPSQLPTRPGRLAGRRRAGGWP